MASNNNLNISIFERVIYAFGLLEVLVGSGLDFLFKGGTCLMLLFDHPFRFSTDIDIVVDEDTDMDIYMNVLC